MAVLQQSLSAVPSGMLFVGQEKLCSHQGGSCCSNTDHVAADNVFRTSMPRSKQQSAGVVRGLGAISTLGMMLTVPDAAFAGLPPLQKLASQWWLPLQQSAAAELKLLLSASILEVNSMATHGRAHIVCSQACFYDRVTCSSRTTEAAPEGC